MSKKLSRIMYKTPVARALAIISLLYSIYYLYWRMRYSLNFEALFFAIPLVLAEIQGVMNFAVFTMMTWDIRPVSHGAPPPGHTVDIFIPTYNEDLTILKMTILGALNVHYPHKTWVLDDGRRPALRQMCAEMGVHYLTRPDNRHHKAGNINAALEQTNGEFVAIFDADHVPLPNFLMHTLGYFVDEQVAFVQTPQEFYNLDSVQHSTDWKHSQTWHEQSVFYRIIQPGKNRWNAAFWCGSGSVMRRSALMSVGGIATDTVTEDIHTSLRLHAAGWKSVYHDEVLCMGLAPQDFLAFTIQRLRWAQGAMQVLRRENPMFKRGLTLVQRINYMASIVTYFESFQRLIYTLAPAFVLITAILPIHSAIIPFLIRFIPYFVLGLVANMALGRGHFKPLETDRYNLLKMTTFIKSAFVLLGFEPRSFKVTPKAASEGRGVVMLLLRPYYVIVSILLLGMVIGAIRLGGLLGPVSDSWAFWMSELWTVYNLWLIFRGIRSVLKHITRRHTYRFPVHVPVTVLSGRQGLTGMTANIHEQGLSLLLTKPLKIGSMVRVLLYLPQQTVGGNLEVRSNKPVQSHSAQHADATRGLWSCGGVFTPDTKEVAEVIDEFLIEAMTHQLQVAAEEIEEKEEEVRELHPDRWVTVA